MIASALIIINIIKVHSIFVRDIDDLEFVVMHFWFSRFWGYTTIPFCIIFSIGIVKAIKSPKFQQKFQKIFKNRYKRDLIKAISFSAMIYLSFSNLIISGIIASDAHSRVDDEEIEIIGWMSKHLPIDSTILIESNYIIQLSILSFSYANFHYISDYFESDDTNEEYLKEINNLKDDDVQYILLSRDFLRDDTNITYFVRSYLIPYFYNESEYSSNNYRIYYAPYFD